MQSQDKDPIASLAEMHFDQHKANHGDNAAKIAEIVKSEYASIVNLINDTLILYGSRYVEKSREYFIRQCQRYEETSGIYVGLVKDAKRYLKKLDELRLMEEEREKKEEEEDEKKKNN